MTCGDRTTSSVEVYKGESKTLQLTILDCERNAVDLTGATLYFTVKGNLNDCKVLFQKTSAQASEILILSPATDGVAEIYISPSDTSALDAGDYKYDIWVVLSSGKQVPVIAPSLFKVIQPVTTF